MQAQEGTLERPQEEVVSRRQQRCVLWVPPSAHCELDEGDNSISIEGDDLSADEEARLAELLKDSPEEARRFAELADWRGRKGQ